jgi:hypothetical protein
LSARHSVHQAQPQLLVGPAHPLAAAESLAPADLVDHRIWIPGIKQGTEWAAYYDELAEAFGLRIDAIRPNFGTEALMDAIADSAALATLVGAGDRYVWPSAHGLRRIPVQDPAPVYPHSLLYRTADPHPTLAALRRYLDQARPTASAEVWAPSWTRGRSWNLRLPTHPRLQRAQDEHVVFLLDGAGGRLAELTLPATPQGYTVELGP